MLYLRAKTKYKNFKFIKFKVMDDLKMSRYKKVMKFGYPLYYKSLFNYEENKNCICVTVQPYLDRCSIRE